MVFWGKSATSELFNSCNWNEKFIKEKKQDPVDSLSN